MKRRHPRALVLLAAAALALAGAFAARAAALTKTPNAPAAAHTLAPPEQSTTVAAAPSPPPAGPVQVLYAGSLIALMEHDLGPAFTKDAGVKFWGEGKGSQALANEIRGELRRADVFISASPEVNEQLMGVENGDWLQWYAVFAASPLVIGYQPKSRFAADFAGKPWYEVLLEPGIRIGRTDPQLDPKGMRTLELLAAAATAYGRPELPRTLLAKRGGAVIFPETDLIGRLQSGQLDAGFLYETEATERGIPYVKPASAVDPRAVYTVAIVRDAPHPAAAQAFVRYLLSAAGRARLERHGLESLPLEFRGDAQAVAKARNLLGATP